MDLLGGWMASDQGHREKFILARSAAPSDGYTASPLPK